MSARRDVEATYIDGAIRPNEPLPELEGLHLHVRLSLPHGEGSAGRVHVEAVYPGPLIEVGFNLAPMVQGPTPLLVPHIKALRAHLRHSTGFPLPPVRMVVSDTHAPRSYLLWLNGKVVGQSEARMTRLLAIAPSDHEVPKLHTVAGEDIHEPVFGLPGKWILPALEEMARDNGLTVARPAKMIANHMEEAVRARLAECLTRDAVHALLDAARENSPRLVQDALAQHHGLPTVHALLRLLLNRKRHIGDLTKILEVLADTETDDVQAIADEMARELPAFE